MDQDQTALPQGITEEDVVEAVRWLRDCVASGGYLNHHKVLLAEFHRLRSELATMKLKAPDPAIDVGGADLVGIAVSAQSIHLGRVRVMASAQVPPHQAYIRALNPATGNPATLGRIINLGGKS